MIVIQKFGGSSLTTTQKLEQMLGHVNLELSKNNKVVVVVSAIGRIGMPYATDTLKTLLHQDVTLQELDRMLACGEVISSVIISSFLNKNNIKSKALSVKESGIKTTDKYGDAEITDIDTSKILHHLEINDVVVVAGYQGLNSSGEVTTLGRGGSDTTAIALGAELESSKVQIISDVNGIKSADPKRLADVVTWKKISYDFLINMSQNGAKVLHYKGAVIAKDNRVPLQFYKLGELNAGTYVTDNDEKYFTFVCLDGFTKYEFTNLAILEMNRFDSSFFIPKSKEQIIETTLNDNNMEFKKNKGYTQIYILKSDNGEITEELAYVLTSDVSKKITKKHEALVKLFTH